jgi:hypothetical protein
MNNSQAFLFKCKIFILFIVASSIDNLNLIILLIIIKMTTLKDMIVLL